MSLIERLRLLLGLPVKPQANIVIDDIFQRFIERSSHAEGNAVSIEIVPGMFTEQNMGELLADDLIYGWNYTESGNFLLYSDRDRLSRFDLESLRQLELNGVARSPARQWWAINE
jgi:hypothetical protein